MGVSVKLTGLAIFVALLEQHRRQRFLRPLDHGRGVHTFMLDPIFLNLKVGSYTFICLKVSTRSR